MSKFREVYITIADFAFLQGMGQIYEGFVIGLGYAFRYSSLVNPPNLNGYLHAENIPSQVNRFTLIRDQYVDNSPEMIERSVNGITANGAKLYTVQKGDTLSSISKQYRVSVDCLIKWNKIKKPDEIQVGQKLIVSEQSRDLLGDYLKHNPLPHTSYGTSTPQTSIPKIQSREVADLISIAASTHGFLPKTQFYNQAAKNGSFVYEKNGELITRSNRYYGNQSQSASTIQGYKNSFNRAIKVNKLVLRGGEVANVLSLGSNMYDVYNGDINSFSYTDIGVGTMGVIEGAASYFYGVEIPFVGEFALLYGSFRLGWDMGQRYGPSEWGRLYRQYKERKRREEFLEYIIKGLDEDK